MLCRGKISVILYMSTLSVTEFLNNINQLLATQVVTVEGEVQGFAVSQGKWVFFSLKDANSIVECFMVMWKLPGPIEDGMTIRVLATPKVYEKNGRFRLMVERVELTGEGALKKAYQLLFAKLEAQGLFLPERKRPLPVYPRVIGLIASAESAAQKDFLTILQRRFGGLTVLFAASSVQGISAPDEIATAFTALSEQTPRPEVIVLTRGGGSMEDLQAFNTETVAMAIARSPVPVISAVGHERDTSIADFVADVRAATPTHAAELVVPNRLTLLSDLTNYARHLNHTINRRLQLAGGELGQLLSQLLFISSRWRERVVALQHRLLSAWQKQSYRQTQQKEQLNLIVRAFVRGFSNIRQEKLDGITQAVRLLAAADPTRLLKRGYSIVRRRGVVVQSRRQLEAGDVIDVTVSDGVFDAEVS